MKKKIQTSKEYKILITTITPLTATSALIYSDKVMNLAFATALRPFLCEQKVLKEVIRQIVSQVLSGSVYCRARALAWPVSMQIYCNKKVFMPTPTGFVWNIIMVSVISIENTLYDSKTLPTYPSPNSNNTKFSLCTNCCVKGGVGGLNLYYSGTLPLTLPLP